MFKENRDFWLFLIGIVILFFIIFGTLRDGFSKSSFMYSGFPFGYVKGDTFVLKKQKVEINPVPQLLYISCSIFPFARAVHHDHHVQ